MHFTNHADEEWHSEDREEIITMLEENFKENQKNTLQIYGLSTISLADYITSDKDIARRISRMPGAEYLISGDS